MPWFEVTTLEGSRWTTATLPEGRPSVVAFLCNHSPYVRHIEAALKTLSEDLAQLGVAVLAIASNDARAYPADSPSKLLAQVERTGWPFPYALDEDQRSARAFGASCTPEFFVYDGDRRLVYHGQFDGSRPASSTDVADGADVRRAVEAVLAGDAVSPRQAPAFGCSIKWRAGNEPAYMFVGV